MGNIETYLSGCFVVDFGLKGSISVKSHSLVVGRSDHFSSQDHLFLHLKPSNLESSPRYPFSNISNTITTPRQTQHLSTPFFAPRTDNFSPNSLFLIGCYLLDL